MIDAAKLVEIARKKQEQKTQAPIAPPAPLPQNPPKQQYPLGYK